jgi:hypothetical protein
VKFPLFIGTMVLLTGLAFCPVKAELPSSPGASSTPSGTNSRSPKLAPFKERLNAAKSVKVQTDILGIELDSSLKMAHARLDLLGDPAKPPVEEKEGAEHGEKEHKVLWQLVSSDFSSVYVKTDDEERITYIMGLLRKDKEMSFEKIGQLDKAPILTNSTVAWDVVRPNRPLIRVIARGENRKASSITIFVVKRAPGVSEL